MRFVWAVVAFVLATVLIGAGIAQRTIFMGPNTQKVSVAIDEPAPFVLIDSDVLRENPGAQTLVIQGAGEIFAAYGRTDDMKAWLADTAYNEVTVADDGSLDVELVTAQSAEGDTGTESPAPTETPDPAQTPDASETPDAEGGLQISGRNPAGSDLWLDSFTDENQLKADEMQLPEGVSMLISYDGTKDAPDDITVSWKLDTSTPFAGPLVAGGGLVLLIGLILYVLGIRHQRRGRGPRRKGPGPLPVTEPIDLDQIPASERAAIEGADAPAPQDDEQGEKKDVEPRNEMRGTQAARRRRMLAIPALAVTALLASGCTADSWPQFGDASPTPSPTPTVIAPENQKPPAVTEAQAERILGEISETLSTADETLDVDLAKTRLDGAALAARTTDYALRAELPDRTPPSVIPTDDVEVVLPEATDIWPRTVLLLSKSTGDDTVPPVILTMVQQDPWSTYKVTNLAEMSADAVFPEVVAPWLGTSLVPDDSAFLSIAPGELATTFSDVVDKGEKSEYYGDFDPLAQSLVASIAASRQSVTQSLADDGASKTSTTAFASTPTDEPAVSLTTLDSGAIVALSFLDTETVTPSVKEAVIRFENVPDAKALTGVTEASKGIVMTYGFQVFFSVPSQGSTEQVRLLAFHQDLLSAEVIK